MPDPVNLPRKLFIPGLQKVTVIPRPTARSMSSATSRPAPLNVTGGPLSFNPLALLTLFEDLATDLPKIIADVQAVFAATPPVPTPAPTPTSPTH